MVIGIEANHANKEHRTGVENYCWQIINNLKKQISSDTRVILYTQRPLLPGLVENMPINWEVKVLKWPFYKLWSQIRLSLEMFLNPPDIFFAPGQLIPFFCPKNTTVTIHDSAFLVNKKAYNFLGRFYLIWMNKRIIKCAKNILTPSEFTKKETLRLYPYLLPEKIFVTPLAYDKNFYHCLNLDERDVNILKKFDITKPFLIYLGRLEEKKNILGLIKAFSFFKKEVDAQLVLVGGPGVGFEKIEKEIEINPCRQDIILTGWLTEKETAQMLNQATVFVFPSFYEGFGLPMLEAFACGLPVIAAKGHSLEEIGKEATIYFDPNNIAEIKEKMKIFFADENRRLICKNSGLELVKNYSWEKTAINTAKILNGLQI
ncbi:MAG TPA: glycosyltransferase family 1 protein [Candidatus Magasanikbacteria bacterium]|nr:glycosyltransferase family 1 protein [Candidatus Magasanikbacteria bacterium]